MADRLVAIPGPEGGDALQVGDWLNQAAELYQPDSIDVLDGRLLIWGLASVDRSLGEYLGSSGFLAALQREIESEKGPLRKLLRDLNRLPPGDLIGRRRCRSIGPSQRRCGQAQIGRDRYWRS